ncbi:helix-turn-helix domain-containing protein [Streptomyces sp. 15-116A]|uniref:helix-turn-helix domain-containing protein n=1 Tax=Streptomyces sp. 15-116A TaxID=2259035 RepID=UPI0037DA777A
MGPSTSVDRPPPALIVPAGAHLWHAATLLREHRGDGHVAALVPAGIAGRERTSSTHDIGLAELLSERVRADGPLVPDGCAQTTG